MDTDILSFLCCPSCRTELDSHTFETDDGDVHAGLLVCDAGDHFYHVIDGIPRFVDDSIIEDHPSYRNHVADYSEEINELLRAETSGTKAVASHIDQSETDEYFGYEWDHWKRWGWYDEEEIPADAPEDAYLTATESETARDFAKKTFLIDEDLAARKVVFDGGCGNGRFANQAAKNGATVIAMDIATPAVEACAANCRDIENLNVIQGNLLSIPVQNSVVDTAYALGVLQHTGDAKTGFENVASTVIEDGVFSARIYHRFNFVFEIVDRILRGITTRLSVQTNMKVARALAAFDRTLNRIHPRLENFVSRFVNLQPATHIMYDWYSAPYASRHTYGEVINWYEDSGFSILQTGMDDWYGNEKRVLSPHTR